MLIEISASAAYIPSILNVLINYGINGIEGPIQSITKYRDFPLPISIRGYLYLLYGIKLLFAQIMMILLIGISYYSKNVITAISISTGLFVIPYVIYMIGATNINKLLWNPNTLGYVYFIKKESFADKAIISVNLIFVSVLSNVLLRKTYLSIKKSC